MKRVMSWGVMCGLLVSLSAVDTARGQWNAAQLLNEPSEAGHDVKSGRVVASMVGGFHALYGNGSTGRLRYRRYDGTLHAPVDAYVGFHFNPEITESLTGQLHVVFEDWSGGGPEVGWVQSSDGGMSFSPRQYISASGGKAKFPQIAPFGLSGSSDVVMSYYNTDNHDMMYDRCDGLAWAGELSMGADGNSEYEVMGMGRSPVDGSIYRTYDNGPWLVMRRYDGSGWSGDINLDNTTHNNDGMHNRQQVAVNDSGQVMVIWDQGDRYFSMLYTPGVGSGPKTTLSADASWGKGLCAIPGTNDFYAVYPRSIGGEGARRIVGRRFTGGAWQPEETVMVGLPDEFSVDPRVSADPNGSGTLYCTFEYWGSGKPQQYFTIRPGSGGGPTGTVSGTVRDQHGTGVPNALVMLDGGGSTLSVAGGSYSLTAVVDTYDATASKPFFNPDTATGVVVQENQTTIVDFTISAQLPAPVASMVIDEKSLVNTVQWQDSTSSNSDGTMIRYSFTSPPVSPGDGAFLVDQAGTPGSYHQHDHTNLTNGVPVYYTAFAYFQDASRYYAAGVSASGTPAVGPDGDHDSDVDMEDFGLFQACVSGRFEPQEDPDCQWARLDADDDVDGDDFEIFHGCLSGAGLYAEPACADQP